MQPQQPYNPTPSWPAPAPQPTNQNHYDFILNPQRGPKRSLLSGGGLLKKLAVIGVIAVILIMILIILGSILGNNSGKFAPMITVAQEQGELIRIASLDNPQASSSSKTQQIAYATLLSLTTAQQQVLHYLGQNHQKVTTKVLALKTSSQATSQLQSSLTNSTFDSTFQDIIQNDLASYSQALKTAYNANPGPKGRQLLKNQYVGAQLLIQQSK